MNALFFYAALCLILAGSFLLLWGRKSVSRRLAAVAVAAGIGVLAGGLKAWAVVGADGVAVISLLLSMRTGSRKEGSAVEEPASDSTFDSPSPLRKGIALLLPAALAGILLSAIWSNPFWRIQTPPEPVSTSPEIGILIYPLIILLLLCLSYFLRRELISGVGNSSEIPEE